MQQMSLNDVATLCNNSDQPVAISVNGTEKLYLMNENTLKNLADILEFAEIMNGFADIENGNYTDGDTFEKAMRDKYDL